MIEFKHLEIDNDAHRVLADNQEVNLTPKEYELLIYLAKTPNKVFDLGIIKRSLADMNSMVI